MKIMASSPIALWQIDRETMETVTDFIFLGSKSLQMVTVAMKLKDSLLGRKVMTNLDNMLSRDITDKGHIVKVMVFPVVMYGCESWTIRKVDHKELMLLNCGVGEDF